MKESIDYAVDLLRRINHIQIEGMPIYKFFHVPGSGSEFSSWSAQQLSLFSTIKKFSASKNFEVFKSLQVKTKIKGRIIDFFLHVIAFFSSVFAIFNLVVFRTRILTYSADRLKKGTNKDPRMLSVYKILEKQEAPYVEVVHTLLGKDFLYNLFRRRRAVLYINTIDLFATPFIWVINVMKYRRLISNVDIGEFSEGEKLFVKHILKIYFWRCFVSRARVLLWEKFFKVTGLKIFFTIDDLRYSNELVEAAQRSGIEACMFQHSNFDYFYNLDTLPPESYAFPSTFYVWNEYWKETIPDLSPLFEFHKEKIKVGGRAYGFSTSTALSRRERSTDGAVTVLIPYETNVDKEKMSLVMEAILKCSKMSIVFSVRPAQSLSKADASKDSQIREYGLSNNGNVEVITAISDEILEPVDLVFGVYSGFLDEMVEREKPVLMLKMDYKTFHSLSEADLAESVYEGDQNLCEKIRHVADSSSMELKERHKKFTAGTGDVEEVITALLSKSFSKT